MRSRVDSGASGSRDTASPSGRGLYRFPADALSMLQTTLLTAGEKFELMGLLARITMIDPERYATQSVAEWLQGCFPGPAFDDFMLEQPATAIAKPATTR